MRKLLALFILAAVGVQAQVTNTVNISNSLLGPVTNVFTNTQITVEEAVITGAVFNASVTNTFSPSITNEINVGEVSVTNNITNDISVTNIIENIAVGVTNTINITNITQTFVTTSGVSSISRTGAVQGAITFEGSGVTQTGSVFNFSGGGGTGNIEINGVTTNAFTFVGQFPVSVTNVDNTFYFGQLGDGGTFIPATGTSEVFNFVGSVTQTFTVPSGVTQLYAYAWGAGGGGGNASGGAGGYSFGYFSVTNGEVLSVVVGEGGFISSATASTAIFTNTLNPFPNGGWGAGRSTQRGGAGGGSSAILRGTNFLVVAGGGGGGSHTGSAGGGGGGTSGQDGFSLPTAGGGATQDAGGAAGTTATALSITNTAGSFYLGGNAGLTTNLLAQSSGGGGGGLYGGGGGVNAGATSPMSGGGGGSGYINTSEGVLGTTVQAQTPASNTSTAQPPPATDDPLYGSPTAATWGRGGAQATAGSNGGMIIRWVEP